jgi:large subunit ribosomal protein L7/L12
MSEDKKEVQVPEKFQKLVSEIEKLSVLDLAELVHVLEEKFGVSAAAPVATIAAPAAGVTAVEAGEEKSSFNVELTESGANKIGVIKVLREVTTLGLKEAKDLVDNAPKMIKEGATKEEAEVIKKKIEEAGGKVVLK